MKMLSEGNFAGINKVVADLKEKVQMMDNGMNDKFKNLKKMISDLEEK